MSVTHAPPGALTTYLMIVLKIMIEERQERLRVGPPVVEMAQSLTWPEEVTARWFGEICSGLNGMLSAPLGTRPAACPHCQAKRNNGEN